MYTHGDIMYLDASASHMNVHDKRSCALQDQAKNPDADIDVLDPACMLPPLFMLPAEMLSAAAAAAAASAVALGQTAAQQARMHACTRARTRLGSKLCVRMRLDPNCACLT